MSSTFTNLLSIVLLKKVSPQDIGSSTISIIPQINEEIIYSVSVFKIEYLIEINEKKIKASAIMLIPEQVNVATEIISIQNGTNFLHQDAISKITQSSNSGFESIASLGYIVLIPDYIGFGSSEENIHPYYCKEYSAFTLIHLFASAHNALSHLNLMHSGCIHLLGFSEGAYISLSAANLYQSISNPIFQIKKVALACGGYDLFGMLGALTQNTSQKAQPAYIVFLIYSYLHYYDWKKSLDYYFQKPYAQLIPELFNGKYKLEEINSKLGDHLGNLFNPEFYHNLAGNGELELKKALFNNSLHHLKLDYNTRFYHSKTDEVIPFQNTLDTMLQLKKSNSEAILDLVVFENYTHQETKIPFLIDALKWLKEQ
jgi:pimeloyl-ACP methyl ester carboxylesterase